MYLFKSKEVEEKAFIFMENGDDSNLRCRMTNHLFYVLP